MTVTRNYMSNDFSKPVIAQILPQRENVVQANTNVIAPGMYKMNTRIIQAKTPQLPQEIRKTNKDVSFSTRVISTTSVSRPQLKSKLLEDRVLHNNSQGKKQEVEDHRRNFNTREPKRNVNQSGATPLKQTVASDSTNQKSRNTTRKKYKHVSKTCRWWYSKITPPGYKWKPKSSTVNVKPNLIEIILFIVDSECSKHMMGNLKLLRNVTIKRVYYVKGLNHNLFSVGQFCDADLEVAFRKSTCYIRDLKGNDLLTGSHGTDLYSITLQDTSTPNPICLMAKASSSQAWLWHHRLSHLNFDTINFLSKYDLLTGLPKLKFVKDHLCSFCELGKAKRKSFKTKTTPISKRRLQILHMDLCGPMRVESINDKKYMLRSFVIPRHEKTPYHIINGQKPSVKFFHIFGSLCYIVQDGENLDKMKEKGDACIFVGYSTVSRGYKVYNKRTRQIVETIHVNFDELPLMTSDHVSSDPVPQCPTTALEQDILSPGPQSQENVPYAAEIVTTSNELDLLFSLMFNALLNGITPVVSKSSDVPAVDAPDQRQQQNTTTSTSTTTDADTPPLNIQTTPKTTSQAPTVTATENINQAKTQVENEQVDEDEFINIFSTPVHEQGETSYRYVDSSN
ncbi:retrovirus-related pol polyprotein from transposon TNT 1-94, partial [Tanacetum coccineum]